MMLLLRADQLLDVAESWLTLKSVAETIGDGQDLEMIETLFSAQCFSRKTKESNVLYETSKNS